uniref:Inner centromere protein n=1 Tax=Hippocampus comes TaxID=109280 RepID=A0A3Q2YT18_HIPCM
MSSVKSSLQSLMKMFVVKTQDFLNDIDNVHMVWLEEIQQEANLMFSRDFNSEPELMPKTPSQKKNSRRKRVSVGRQEEVRRRFSKSRRSNLRGSSVKPLNFISEEAIADDSAAESSTSMRPKRSTRKTKQTKAAITEDVNQLSHIISDTVDACNKKPELVDDEGVAKNSELDNADVQLDESRDVSHSPVAIPSPGVVVSIPASERLSAEEATQPKASPGRSAAKIAIAGKGRSSRRSSMRCSLKVRHSLGGLRHSMMQESRRRTSRQSMLKKKAARKANSSRSSNIDSEKQNIGKFSSNVSTTVSEQPCLARITRSVAANSPKLAPPSTFFLFSSFCRSTNSIKRKAPYTTAESPTKRFSPPKKSQSALRPNMKSFLHTVQKNQMLMMTPNSFTRNTLVKSFIKHATPLKIDTKAKERQKLEALKKKQEQEEERMRKMEEEKKKKQEEFKRSGPFQNVSLSDLIGRFTFIIRQAAEMAKKRTAMKRQEELELKRKLEEETKKKKIQQAEEEKRQQELLAKKAKEEELKAKKLAEARRALELKKEQERERELERERLAAAERERVEREKALALQRELERAAREKERKELEEKRKQEEQQKLAAEEKAMTDKEAAAKQAANAKKSPQSYSITPKGGNKTVTLSKNPENYGMDQNSDDSTDDESAPRKPIPSWAEGHNLQQIIMKQYFNPPDLDAFFGTIEPPKLENLFYKSKPRYFKRTSSAVWHSPPNANKY